MPLAMPSHCPWFDCLNIVCCRVQTSLSSRVALHNLFSPRCHLSTVLYSVHFVIIPAAWGCAMPWWWSHLTWPLTVSHAIYHFAFIFCSFWDTFSLKYGRYSDHKERFMWHIKKRFLMALIGYKIGTFFFDLWIIFNIWQYLVYSHLQQFYFHRIEQKELVMCTVHFLHIQLWNQ